MATISALSPVLRLRTRERVQLWFVYSFSLLFGRLSKNVAREVCSFFGTVGFLPALDTSSDSLLLYDLATEVAEVVRLGEKFMYGVVCCCVSEIDLLAIGGYKVQQVTRLNMLNGTATPEQPLSVERSWPGLIVHNEAVFVFGGSGGILLNSCEKFVLSSRQWLPLPAMSTPKACFTPCLYCAEIYLAETDRTLKALEAFDPVAERYRLLPLQLYDLYLGTVCFVVQDEIVVLSYSCKVGRWRFASEDLHLSVTPVESTEQTASACSPLVRVGSQVYWANSECTLVSFDTHNLILRYRTEVSRTC